MFVLDSSALIEVAENKQQKQKVLEAVGNALLITTSICMHEVLTGADSEKRRFILEGIFAKTLVLDHDRRAALIGSRIGRDLNRKGSKLEESDLLIASICMVHDAELVTLDKGFTRIEGLKVKIIK